MNSNLLEAQRQFIEPFRWNTQIRRLINEFNHVPTSLLTWKKPEEYQKLIKLWERPIRHRIQIQRTSLSWANDVCRKHHYLKTAVSGYASPFAYEIRFDESVAGMIVVGTPFARKLKGEYGYDDVCSCWSVLQIYRFWVIPHLQHQSLKDSQGRQHTLAIGSCAMGKLVKQIERDWLTHHPPREPSQPYRIRKILTYSDSTIHSGTLYKSAGFRHHASNCGKTRQLDRWILDLPESQDPLLQVRSEQGCLLEPEKQKHSRPKLNRCYHPQQSRLRENKDVTQLTLM